MESFKELELFVRIKGIEGFLLKVTSSMSVQELKAKVSKRTKIDLTNVEVLHRDGQQLEDNNKLADYHLENCSFIYFMHELNQSFQIFVRTLTGSVYPFKVK